jgi:hypothetical protein
MRHTEKTLRVIEELVRIEKKVAALEKQIESFHTKKPRTQFKIRLNKLEGN